ncbi:hypothetical protein JHK87_044127 [Glycine soja]|nr:hypothetical protein JHK87_044127 [Glycine soja]
MLSGANVEYDLPIPIKDESETLSDIDDAELDVYIHNEKEKNMKKTLWERAYREYLERSPILYLRWLAYYSVNKQLSHMEQKIPVLEQ